MRTTVVAKTPMSEWDLKSLLFTQLRGDCIGESLHKNLLTCCLLPMSCLFLFLLFVASPSSLPPTSPAVVLSCSSVNV